jgi:hypothetical protein
LKKLVAGALLLALSGAPAIVQGQTNREPPTAVGRQPAQPAPVSQQTGASDYAAREAAAPELGEFTGGGGGVYIGSSALVVVLLVIIIVILV